MRQTDVSKTELVEGPDQAVTLPDVCSYVRGSYRALDKLGPDPSACLHKRLRQAQPERVFTTPDHPELVEGQAQPERGDPHDCEMWVRARVEPGAGPWRRRTPPDRTWVTDLRGAAGGTRQGRILGRRAAQQWGRRAQRASSSDSPGLFERSERSERSEFPGATPLRAAQCSRRIAPTAPDSAPAGCRLPRSSRPMRMPRSSQTMQMPRSPRRCENRDQPAPFNQTTPISSPINTG